MPMITINKMYKQVDNLTKLILLLNTNEVEVTICLKYDKTPIYYNIQLSDDYLYPKYKNSPIWAYNKAHCAKIEIATICGRLFRNITNLGDIAYITISPKTPVFTLKGELLSSHNFKIKYYLT